MNIFLRNLSILFYPTVIAAVVVIIFSVFSPINLGSLDIFSSIILGIFFLSVIPTLPILYFRKRGIVDIDVSDRRKRPRFFLIALLSYFTAALIFWFADSLIMFSLSVAYLSVLSAITLLNFFSKISAHSAGIAGPTTAIVYVFGLETVFLFGFTLIIIWIRWKLKAHDLKQLVAGALVGVLITFLTYLITFQI